MIAIIFFGRRIVGENAILECKTTNSFGSKDWDGEDIPASYILQCQHYMAVTGADKCYIAVLIGGQKFAVKEIVKDEELINIIIEEEKEFWMEHVEKRIAPELDGSTAASNYLRDRFTEITGEEEIDLKSDYKEKIDRYLDIKNEVKILEEELKAIENNIKNELGNAERGSISKFLVSWRAVISRRVDSKILKAKYPDIYKEVCKEARSRRFEIKEVAE